MLFRSSETKKVSLYVTDFDEGNRESEIYALAADGTTELIPTIEIFAYEEGWYLQFIMSGKVQFDFESVGGPNTVISGVFFDPDPDAVVEAPAVADEEFGSGGGDPVELPAAVAEAPAPPAAVPAPATADPVSLIIIGSLASAAGVAVFKKRK